MKHRFVGKVLYKKYKLVSEYDTEYTNYGIRQTKRNFPKSIIDKTTYRTLLEVDQLDKRLKVDSSVFINEEELVIEEIIFDVANNTNVYVTSKVVDEILDHESQREVYEFQIQEINEKLLKEQEKLAVVSEERNQLKIKLRKLEEQQSNKKKRLF